MADKDSRHRGASDLRQQAEARLREEVASTPECLDALSMEAVRKFLHELRVHQVELEMQNEELRRAQVELDAAKARYFDLYDLAPVGYLTASARGLIQESNLMASTLLGLARRELKGKPISRFILKEDQDLFYLQVKQLVRSGDPQACDLRVLKKDGTSCWAHMEATVAQDSEGAPTTRIVLSDVTGRKHAEAELLRLNEELESRIEARTAELRAALDTVFLEVRERQKASVDLEIEKEKFRTVADHTFDWEEWVGPDGSAIYISPSCERITGYTPEEFRDDPGLFMRIVHPEDAPAVGVDHHSVIEHHDRRELEFRIRTRKGDVRWIGHLCQPVYSADGTWLGQRRSHRDITDRHEAVQALQDSQKALHGLSARIISIQENERHRVARDLHDSIGSTLSAIKFMVERSLDAPCPHETDCHMKALRTVVPVIQDSVEEVRRISMALRPLTLDDLGLTVTIEWFLREFQANHPDVIVEKQVGLAEQEIPDSLRINIFRILQEGLNNAAKHSQASRVGISLRQEKRQIILELEDDGVGFDPAHLDLPDFTGGFGLAFMRERAGLSGGQLSILTAPGKGTRIRAQWPMALPPSADHPPMPHLPSTQG